VIADPPLYGAVQVTITLVKNIDVVGAAGVLGTCAANTDTVFDIALYPTEF